MPTISNALGQSLYTDEREQIYEQMAGKYLRNAQLSGMDLQGIDFRDCNLAEANFEGSNLSGCKFDKSDLSKANLRNAIFDRASMRAVKLEEANLENASMRGVDLEEANIRKASVAHVDLTDSKLIRADLSEANLENATVANAFFSSTRMDRANISGVDFSDNNLLKSNHGGVFTTWNSAHQTADWWPPRLFHTDSADPVFDQSTKWPRAMRFPKRVLRLKDIAIHAFWIWVTAVIVLVIGVLLGSEVARAFAQYRESAIPVVAIAIATAAELFRVIQTNQIIDTKPERYFSSTIYECEKGSYGSHTRPNGSGYGVASHSNRTESFVEFLWSLLKSA